MLEGCERTWTGQLHTAPRTLAQKHKGKKLCWNKAAASSPLRKDGGRDPKYLWPQIWWLIRKQSALEKKKKKSGVCGSIRYHLFKTLRRKLYVFNGAKLSMKLKQLQSWKRWHRWPHGDRRYPFGHHSYPCFVQLSQQLVLQKCCEKKINRPHKSHIKGGFVIAQLLPVITCINSSQDMTSQTYPTTAWLTTADPHTKGFFWFLSLQIFKNFYAFPYADTTRKSPKC